MITKDGSIIIDPSMVAPPSHDPLITACIFFAVLCVIGFVCWKIWKLK